MAGSSPSASSRSTTSTRDGTQPRPTGRGPLRPWRPLVSRAGRPPALPPGAPAATPLALAPAGQGRVGDDVVAPGHEQRVQLPADQVVVVQGDGAALLDDHLRRAAGRLQPL